MAGPNHLETIQRALRQIREAHGHEKNEVNEKRGEGGGGLISFTSFNSCPSPPQNRFGRFGRAFTALEARCPAHVEVMRWQHAIEDGSRFLATWGEQAEALRWTAADLFKLHPVPSAPHPTYSRLSRYDCTGLIWLLQGRGVVALTESAAAIRNPTGNITVYRRSA